MQARKITVQEMEEVVEFLNSKGLTEEIVAGLILEFPQVLCYSVTDRLTPFFDYLVGEVGLSEAQVSDSIKHRPVLLGLEKSAIERLVGYFGAKGDSKEEIIHLLKTTL